jgi:hypothetical protein
VVTDLGYSDLTLSTALRVDGGNPNADYAIHKKLFGRVSAMATEMSTFRQWADRFDNLYFTTNYTENMGFDLWPEDPSATTPGRSHVSLTGHPAVYVDVPAALQAYPPIENMLAKEDSPESRDAANGLERLRKAWKAEEKWPLKRHKAAVIKGLYGKTSSFVYYDEAEKRGCADVVQNPRNLWMGYRSDNYEKLEWVAQVQLMEPNEVIAQFSVDLEARYGERDGDGNQTVMPWVVPSSGETNANAPHEDLSYGPARIEVWDYWYRMPGKPGKRGKPTKMETWNVVIAGNEVVRGPYMYSAYEGTMPYVPLFNTFIPSTPTGRSDLHDIEMLIREKMARITAGAQMIAKATAGDYWQLTGADAPSAVPPGAKPKLNEVATPGAGNRIEAITPVIVQFQLEQFLARLDREMTVESGLNDLLLGLAPAQVLSSSKAINALIANYEARISMRRLLFYTWDRDTWELVLKVWAPKSATLRKILAAGGGTLDIIDPSLSPKDEMETATRAANLVAAKLWSQARGMDATGVEDPEQEQNIIREERTDATLFPESVQVMAQLMGILQSLGLQPPAGAQAQAEAQAGSGQEALRQALGAGTPQGTVGSQGEGNQGLTPPIPGAPPEAGGAPAPFAQAAPQGATTQLQGMLQNGQAKGRIMTKQDLPMGRK